MSPTLEAAMQLPAYRAEVAHINRRWAREAQRRGDHEMAARILREIEEEPRQ